MPAGEREGVRGQNCVAGAGNVNRLITSMNRDLCEAIAGLEKGRPCLPRVTRSDCNFISERVVRPARASSAESDRWPYDALPQARLRLVWRR